MIPKIETSANKAKTKSLTRMPTAEKAMKERDKCLWQRKKEQTTNACGKQKMAALIRQASKQLTPNKRNKTAETTSKPQMVAY